LIRIIKIIFLLFLTFFSENLLLGAEELGFEKLSPQWLPVNLPDNLQFSGAVGSRFKIIARVKNSIISPGSAFDFEVELNSVGKVLVPPGDIDVDFSFGGNQAFKIEPLPERTEAGPARWRYFFKLWPSKEGHLVVPEIAFAYINPDIPWVEKRLMIDFSDSIEVEVLQREIFAMDFRGPDVVFDVEELRKSPWINSVKLIGFSEFVWLFFTPPFVGIVIWSITRFYKSLEALKERGRISWMVDSLLELKSQPVDVQADRIFNLMQEYIHRSCGISGVITSNEISAGGFSKLLSAEESIGFSMFFNQIEAVKFNRVPTVINSNLVDQAIGWIRILEVRR